MPPDGPDNDVVLESLAFTRVGDLVVLCQSAIAPSDDEWNRWVAYHLGGGHRGVLISTDGGAPNSSQRARVAEAVKDLRTPRPPLVLLTDSAVMRSVMTAFTWLLGAKQPMKALPRLAVNEAVQWLGVDVQPERVRETMARLQTALGRVASTRRAR